MDFQIEFTDYELDSKFSIDPRTITKIAQTGDRGVVFVDKEETIVAEGYHTCKDKLHTALIAIREYERVEAENAEICREHADGKFARTPIPQSSRWSF